MVSISFTITFTWGYSFSPPYWFSVPVLGDNDGIIGTDAICCHTPCLENSDNLDLGTGSWMFVDPTLILTPDLQLKVLRDRGSHKGIIRADNVCTRFRSSGIW